MYSVWAQHQLWVIGCYVLTGPWRANCITEQFIFCSYPDNECSTEIEPGSLAMVRPPDTTQRQRVASLATFSGVCLISATSHYISMLTLHSTAEAVISSVVIWSQTKVLNREKFWPHDGARSKFRGSQMSLASGQWGHLYQVVMAIHPIVVKKCQPAGEETSGNEHDQWDLSFGNYDCLCKMS